MAPELVIGDSPAGAPSTPGDLLRRHAAGGLGRSHHRMAGQHRQRAVMSIPMVSGGETIGAVSVTRPRGAPPFTMAEAARALISSHRWPAQSGSAVSPISCAASTRPPPTSGPLSNSLRLLMESAGEGIYGIDGEGRCTFMNAAAARALGVDPAEAIGRSPTRSSTTPAPTARPTRRRRDRSSASSAAVAAAGWRQR